MKYQLRVPRIPRMSNGMEQPDKVYEFNPNDTESKETNREIVSIYQDSFQWSPLGEDFILKSSVIHWKVKLHTGGEGLTHIANIHLPITYIHWTKSGNLTAYSFINAPGEQTKRISDDIGDLAYEYEQCSGPYADWDGETPHEHFCLIGMSPDERMEFFNFKEAKPGKDGSGNGIEGGCSPRELQWRDAIWKKLVHPNIKFN